MDYGGRLFRPVEMSETSQTGTDTIFKYEQIGDMVTATYSGGSIKFGQIIGRVDAAGILEMRYQHIDHAGELRTGQCTTTPEILPGGKMRLHESWRGPAETKQKARVFLKKFKLPRRPSSEFSRVPLDAQPGRK